VFNSDNETWKFHRSMTRPFFSRDRISHFDLFDRHASDVIALLKGRMREGLAVDFQVRVVVFVGFAKYAGSCIVPCRRALFLSSGMISGQH
jgi:hypothetical protein